MIQLYSGTPGSGKSFHATQRIFYCLRGRKNVICNYDINLDNCRKNVFQFYLSKIFKHLKGHKRIGDFVYKNNTELTVDFLKQYAKEHHNRKKEGQTLVVIDECGIIFNPRTFLQADRLRWIEFFSLHRHYGFDFILVSQSDRMLDRQIRSFIEYEHKHRKVNNFGLGGMIIHLLTASTWFIDVKIWYGIREKVSSEWMRYSSRIASLYDTMYLEEDDEGNPADAVTDDVVDGLPESGGTEGGPTEDSPATAPSDTPVSRCSLPDS